MRELRRKTFLTVFAILFTILLASAVMINIMNYNRENEGIRRSLLMNERTMRGIPDGPVDPQRKTEPAPVKPADLDPERMMVFDHEVYTVILSGESIDRIISHGNASDDFDAGAVAEEILKNARPGRMYTGNLFFDCYSYNYEPSGRIVIINNSEVSSKLRKLLFVSIAAVAAFAAILAFLSKLITDWIAKPAQEAFDRQKEFISDASHELKTPLAVIMASADELSNEGDEKSSPSKRLIENIRYESDRMSLLIKDLLDLSKMDEGVVEKHTVQDLSRITERAVLAFEAVAFEKGVTIDTDIKDGIEFSCSKDEMERMISVLTDNAIKHSYKDTAVSVVLAKEKNRIVLTVKNTGDPIPKEDLDRIFERFYRGDISRNRQDNRYGLGLAIAKKISQNHNGDITAASSGGKTVFTAAFRTV